MNTPTKQPVCIARLPENKNKLMTSEKSDLPSVTLELCDGGRHNIQFPSCPNLDHIFLSPSTAEQTTEFSF